MKCKLKVLPLWDSFLNAVQVPWNECQRKQAGLTTKRRNREHQHAGNDLIQLREVSLTAFLQYSFAKHIESVDVFYFSLWALYSMQLSLHSCQPHVSHVQLHGPVLYRPPVWIFVVLHQIGPRPHDVFFPSPAGRQIVSTIKCLFANLNFHIKILQGIFACL